MDKRYIYFWISLSITLLSLSFGLLTIGLFLFGCGENWLWTIGIINIIISSSILVFLIINYKYIEIAIKNEENINKGKYE